MLKQAIKNQLLFQVPAATSLLFFTLLWLVFQCSASAAVSSNTAVENWIDQGKKAYDLAQYEEAFSDFKKVLALDSQNSSALYAQGLALIKMKRWAEARAAFQAAAAADPANPKVWLGLAWTSEKTGNSVEAVRCYQKLFQLEADSFDIGIARDRLTRLGVSVAVSESVPLSENETAFTKSDRSSQGWKPTLSLHGGAGYDNDLNAAGPFSNNGENSFGDGFGAIAASFEITSAAKDDPRFKGDAFYQYKNYFSDTSFNSHTFLGKAAFESPLVSSLNGETGVGGETFLQLYGTNYYSDWGWAGLKFKEGTTGGSVVYTYSQEIFSNLSFNQNYRSLFLGLGNGGSYLNPNDSNHQVEVKAYERIFPWMTLSARYQFKDNQATGALYQYLGNSLGGGAEFFFFSGDNLVAGLQFNYLRSFRQCSTPNQSGNPLTGIISVYEQDWVDLFTAECDFPLQPGWSADLSYRYESFNSNISFLSYTDNSFELGLSYQFL